MNFRSLETFIWIARLGSFRAAAQRLYTSQPSVSARISGLEDELGVELFERTGRRVVLTAKGRELLAYAEKLLHLHGEMLQVVAKSECLQGSIRLGVAETIAYTWLPRLIERVSEAYPAINLELDIDISVNLADKLTSHDIDIAFLMGKVNQPGFTSDDLCRYSLVWVASPRLALPAGPVTLSELAQWPIITYPRRSEPYAVIRSLVDPMNHSTRIHSSSSLSTIIRMALDGIGVSALPREIVSRELESGTLRQFNVEAALPDLAFSAAYSTAPGANVVRAVAELSLHTARLEGFDPLVETEADD
ncbi:LysR family transcriptional regulator [Halomonas sp. MCCC 1A17488]|uniref:LysR family transcriptional regulator n=1 Tax=unclassified Halomonas TaxID=2609666 RepID=UPI0018D220D2|nr:MULTISPECIES: LysR family transcriptional regulator [unclassified Halomonas]MCE8014993.1 LysR family transcriptional regulator [Halomonas sp. MCCC 1A17488]MCG3238326.1 LysR family transcriptional regulator [Halomonas sp. MCCC 1A17488]QPP47923.1 LysR family transcriptional regulator [Halomonas sp. SS10-MC5]